MLDNACQIVDDAGGDDLIVGEWEFLQYAIFMLMPGIGERQHESADIGLLQERQYVGEWDVAIVRPFVISPADVEPYPVARHIDDRFVGCRDDALDKGKKLANRAIVVG